MLGKPSVHGGFLVLAGMMEVSSKPKQIKQMLLLLSKGKQTVANQADNENENENVNVNGNGNENGKTPSSSSVHGQQLLLNKPPDGGPLLPPANGRKGQGRTTTTPNGIGFVLLDKTGGSRHPGLPFMREGCGGREAPGLPSALYPGKTSRGPEGCTSRAPAPQISAARKTSC